MLKNVTWCQQLPKTGRIGVPSTEYRRPFPAILLLPES